MENLRLSPLNEPLVGLQTLISFAQIQYFTTQVLKTAQLRRVQSQAPSTFDRPLCSGLANLHTGALTFTYITCIFFFLQKSTKEMAHLAFLSLKTFFLDNNIHY